MAAVAGPFYFARIADPATVFDDTVHNVMDFYIFSFQLEQAETEFASLTIEIENPGIDGLLAAGQPLWCIFAWDNGTSLQPLFKGRLVAIPTNLLELVITLKFVARPDDYEDQRAAIAQQIRDYGAPFWDELFVDEQHELDTDAALEAIASDWHTDPVTLQVSLTDILAGEDGTVNFTSGEAFVDDLDVQIGETPVQAIDVEMSVPWRQTFGGSFPLGTWQWGGPGAAGVASSWPKTGDGFSGGYSCFASQAVVTRVPPEPVSWQIQYQNEAKTHRNGDTMSIQESFSGIPGGDLHIDLIRVTVGDPYHGVPAHTELQASGAQIWSSGAAVTSMSLAYGMDRDRTEKLTFTVRSDLQNVLRNPDDPQVPEKIQLNGRTVTDLVGTAPSYFMTPRGDNSAQYGIMRAVARLKLGARIVTAIWGTTFAKGVTLSCRKSASLADPRLQHDLIVGKITRYQLQGDGDSGDFHGAVTIGAAIGLGNAIVEDAGTPTYCNEDYVDPGYQMYDGQIVAIGEGDVAYSPPIVIPNDDGLIFPLTADQVVVRLEAHQNEIKPGTEDTNATTAPSTNLWKLGAYGQPIMQSYKEQRDAQVQKLADELGKQSSWLEVELKSLEGQAFATAATMDVQNLVMPMQYNVTSP